MTTRTLRALAVACALAAPLAGQGIVTPRLGALDYALLATSTTGLALDWTTTLDLRRRNHTEANPILGTLPGVTRVDAYMAACTLANVAVAKIRRPWLRRAIWGAVTVAEVQAVTHNWRELHHQHQVGVILGFPLP